MLERKCAERGEQRRPLRRKMFRADSMEDGGTITGDERVQLSLKA